MVIQGRWQGTITERIFRSLQSVVDYFRGLPVEATKTQLLQDAITRTESVLDDARRRLGHGTSIDEIARGRSSDPLRSASLEDLHRQAGAAGKSALDDPDWKAAYEKKEDAAREIVNRIQPGDEIHFGDRSVHTVEGIKRDANGNVASVKLNDGKRPRSADNFAGEFLPDELNQFKPARLSQADDEPGEHGQGDEHEDPSRNRDLDSSRNRNPDENSASEDFDDRNDHDDHGRHEDRESDGDHDLDDEDDGMDRRSPDDSTDDEEDDDADHGSQDEDLERREGDEHDLEARDEQRDPNDDRDDRTDRRSSRDDDRNPAHTARDEIANRLAPYAREIFADRMRGASPEEIAARRGITPDAAKGLSDNIANHLAGLISARGIDPTSARAAVTPTDPNALAAARARSKPRAGGKAKGGPKAKAKRNKSPRGKKAIARFNYGKHLEFTLGVKRPKVMKNPHAHHIVFKRGNGRAQRALVNLAHGILRAHGVDPILGSENLVWAPLYAKGQHSTASLRETVNALQAAHTSGKGKSEVIKTLKRFGKKAARRT